MRIILFEFRKNILRKSIILPIVILMIVNIIVIYAQYRFNNDAFSTEVTKYNSSKGEWKYYKELHTQLDGDITEEKQDKVIQLYDNLKEEIDKGDYDTGYTKNAGTGYIFGDYSLIESNFYLPIKNMVSYTEKNNKLVNQAKENIKFYKKTGNKYELAKNQYIVKKYRNRVIHNFYDTTDWKKLLSYNFSDIVLIIFLFLCVLPLFHQEQICGMENIILTTKKGRKMYFAGKYISVITGIVMCAVIVAGINYLMFYFIYGLKGTGLPIYALEEFQYSPYNLTMLQAYFVMLGLKCLALIVISTFLCLVANMIKNTMLSFVIFIGAVVGGLYCSGYVCSDSVQKVMIAIASPFCLFKCSDVFKSLYEMNVFGNFELRIYTCIFVQIVLEVILVLISYYRYKHFNSGTYLKNEKQS